MGPVRISDAKPKAPLLKKGFRTATPRPPSGDLPQQDLTKVDAFFPILSGTFEWAYGCLTEAVMKTYVYRMILATLGVMATGGLGLAQSLPATPGRDLSIGTSTFNVRTMDFDLWCQQTQRYAADRCAARRAEDVKAFEDYRSSIERYELDYLKQVQKDQDVRTRTNRDPSQTVSGKQDGVP